jgi:hypothetical protein
MGQALMRQTASHSDAARGSGHGHGGPLAPLRPTPHPSTPPGYAEADRDRNQRQHEAGRTIKQMEEELRRVQVGPRAAATRAWRLNSEPSRIMLAAARTNLGPIAYREFTKTRSDTWSAPRPRIMPKCTT